MSEWTLIALIMGLVVGGGIAWFLATAKTSGTIAELRSQLSQRQTTLQDRDQEIGSLYQQVRTESEAKVAALTKLQSLEDAEQRLSDTFNALARKILQESNEQFLQLAGESFKTLQKGAEGDLGTRQKAIEGLVQPLQDSLQRYEQQISEMEKSRQFAYGDLGQQIQNLQRVAGNLDLALRGQQAQPRGQWGELTLARVLELAGLPEPYVSVPQPTLEGESGKLRPDRIVYLPGGRCIAIDAKAPLEAFQKAVSATTEEERAAHLKDHSRLVRGHMAKLADKKYWEPLQPAPEIVVLFLPGESFFSAALEQDEKLVQDALAKQIILASPTTLLALLRAIEYGWRQERLAQNAQEISDLGKDLYDRIRKFTEHFVGVGYSLGKAVDSYDSAVGSFKERLLKTAMRFKELGAATGEEIPEVEAIEKSPRLLEVAESSEPE